MSVPKVDIVFKEVSPPVTGWCESGHKTEKLFKRSGPDSEPEPTRFFRVVGQGVNQMVCEPCLIVAIYVGRQIRKRQKG